MQITEVRIKLMEEPGERLKAFCSLTFDDCFVVRDLKIIEGTTGPFVAMPSRKLTSHCPQCGTKNHLKSNYCNQCGRRLDASQILRDADGRAKLYADIAHPINSACREQIQEHVVREYFEEIERAKKPGYVSRYDDIDLEDHTPRERVIRVDGAHGRTIAGPPHHPPQVRPADSPPMRVDPGNATEPSPQPPTSTPAGPGNSFGAGIL